MEQKSWYDLYEKEFFKINFEAIRQYMSLVNWQWSGRGVPSIEDLKGSVSSLFHAGMRTLNENSLKRYTRVRSGGFSVCFFTWGDTRCVEIYFDISNDKKTIAEAMAEKLSS